MMPQGELEARLAALEQENARLREQISLLQRDSGAPPFPLGQMYALLDQLPVLVHAHDEQMRFVFWNRESERVTGYSREFIRSHPQPHSVLYPDKMPQVLQHIMQHSHNQDYLELKIPLTCADGQRKVIAWSNISSSFPIPGWWSWQIGFDVTPGNMAFTQLRETREQARQILELSPEAMLLHHEDQIEYANNAALELFGEVALPGAMNAFMQQLLEAGACAGRDEPFKPQHICPAGEDKYVEVVSSSIRSQSKPATLTLVRDVTQRILHEQELLKSRNILRVLLDSTDDYFILVDTRFIIEACNISWSALFGLHPREIIGRNALGLLPRTIRNRLRERGADCLRHNMPVFFVVEHEGHRFNCKLYPLATDGKVERMAFYAHDVTQIRQAQQARYELEVRYKAVFDHAGDAIFIYDERGALLAANRTLCNLLGYTEPALQSLSMDQLLHNRSDWRALLANGQENAAIWELHRREGPALPLEINARPIPYLDVPAVLCVGRDVSNWQAAQELLRQAKDTAEETLRIQNEFVANISHELRTPLGAIIGITELLAAAPLDLMTHGHVRRIAFSADVLLNLINDLLDLSKLESGAFSLEKRPFNLLYVMQEVKDLLVIQAARKGLDFSYAVDDSISDVYLGDAPRLRQVLLNIAGNAIKFTNSGSVRMTVQPDAGSQSSACHLHFTVSDTGIGIAAQDITRVFQRFAQARDARSRAHGGAGLGLYISRDLIQRMGGRIWVESTHGQGSHFHFTVALAPCPETMDCTSLAGQSSLRKSSPRRLLLVEDNEVNREVLKAMLELDGHLVHTAADGLQALELLNDFTPEMVFMDVQMPNLDGLETTRRIRALPDPVLAGVPIVSLSAHAQRESAAACLEAGMTCCLTKPIRLDELRCAVIHLGQPPGMREQSNIIIEESPATLDLETLQRNMGHEPPLMRIACEKFIEHSQDVLAEMQAAAARREASTVARLAHSFKSMAGTVGALAARQLAIRLEQQAKLEDWSRIDQEMERLRQTVQEAMRAIEALRPRLAGDQCTM